MNNIDLESERLIFCRLSDKHISTDYVNWINDSEVNTYLETRGNYTIDQLKSSRANLMMNKASLSDKMAKLGKKTVEYKRLKQDVAAAQENYERENRQLLESMRAASLAETPVLVS